MTKLLAAILDKQEADWVKSITFKDGLVPAITALHIGDAWLTTDTPATICVEHKTANDLIGSVLDDGLLNQGVRMAAEGMFNWRYLIYTMPEVRGEFVVLQGRPTKIRWRHISGVLVDLQEMGITCIPIAADSEYGSTLEWIATRDHGDVRAKASRQRRKGIMETDQEFFLAGIKGIDTKAKLIMDQCGTAAWALDWLTDLHCDVKIPGISTKTKEGVRRLLGCTTGNKISITPDDWWLDKHPLEKVEKENGNENSRS